MGRGFDGEVMFAIGAVRRPSLRKRATPPYPCSRTSLTLDRFPLAAAVNRAEAVLELESPSRPDDAVAAVVDTLTS